MRLHTANGSTSVYRQRQRGRRQRVEQMAASIHGVTSHRRLVTRTSAKRIGTTMGSWGRLGRLKMGRVPMVSTIWPGMSGNGSVTSMTSVTTRAARQRTPQARLLVEQE